MQLIRQVQNSELLDAEKEITEKIHRQFLNKAKLEGFLTKPDNFYNDVSLEGATDTFEKLNMNLQTKLEDIIGISNKKIDLQTGKRLLDNGAILTEWNSLTSLVISPKTKGDIVDQISAKLYALDDVINKICYEYKGIITNTNGLLSNRDLYKAYCNQIISGLGIYIVMQSQINLKSLSPITLNKIREVLTFDFIRTQIYGTANGWNANFEILNASPVGYVGLDNGGGAGIPKFQADRKIIVDTIINMFSDTVRETSIGLTKKKFLEKLANQKEPSPMDYTGLPNLVYNDPSLAVLNPIYAKAIRDAEESKEDNTIKYTPTELIEMGQKANYAPNFIIAMMQIESDTRTHIADITNVFNGYEAKYAVGAGAILDHIIIEDTRQILDIVMQEYNIFGLHSSAEVADKIASLKAGDFRAWYVANPRGTNAKKTAFYNAIVKAKTITLNYINANYNYKIERIIKQKEGTFTEMPMIPNA